MTPPKVPDHELLRLIGRGSYGEVWLARNVMGSYRAVKVVYRAAFDNERPYEREFGGLQKFEPVSRGHPGLISILHVGRNPEGGYFYCIMEAADDLARGETITPEQYQPRTLASEVTRRKRLPITECLELAAALASALGHLHANGLVHRDIKPPNIIFVGGRPKLADIGLVTQIGTKVSFVGTEGYLAPEGPGSPSADLYSLGRLLYEIAMGKTQEQFPELPTNLRELPEAALLMRLNSIVMKLCEHQEAKRYRSAADLEEAIAELQREVAGSSRTNTKNRPDAPGAGLRVLVLAIGAEPAHAALATRLADLLAQKGFTVHVDAESELSLEWARGLEDQVRTAQAVIPLLTRANKHNEMMAYALEIAAQSARRPDKSPRLLAISTPDSGPLPRKVSLALEKHPMQLMPEPESTIDELMRQLSSLMESSLPEKP